MSILNETLANLTGTAGEETEVTSPFGDHKTVVITFLYAVAGLASFVIFLMLYLNKVACFKICNGKTCFDIRHNKKAHLRDDYDEEDD